jgi:uncharacterized protein (TIRG00374 family)
MASKGWKFSIKYILSFLLAAALVTCLVYWMDMPTLVRSLREALLLPVIVAVLLNVLVMAAKGVRWYILAADSSSISLWQSVRLTILGFFVNSFIPARGGDVLKGLAAARENRTSRATSIASVGLDKLMDMVTVFFLAAAFPFLPQLPPWLKRGTLLSLVLAYALFAVVLVIAIRGRGMKRGEGGTRFMKFFRKLASGFDSAVRPRKILAAVLLSLVSYGLQIGMVHLCCLSTGISLSIPESACALLALNIAVSVPLTPLNVGTLHAAFVGMLLFFGSTKEPAMTAAIALHLSYTLPLLLLGPFLGHRTLLMSGAETKAAAGNVGMAKGA